MPPCFEERGRYCGRRALLLCGPGAAGAGGGGGGETGTGGGGGAGGAGGRDTGAGGGRGGGRRAARVTGDRAPAPRRAGCGPLNTPIGWRGAGRHVMPPRGS